MSPAASTVTPTGDLYYDTKYTCSRANNPRGFDRERYLMAFPVTSNCTRPVLGSGSVQVMVQERGSRPLTNVHVVKSELVGFPDDFELSLAAVQRSRPSWGTAFRLPLQVRA
jgi:hypothetical protein